MGWMGQMKIWIAATHEQPVLGQIAFLAIILGIVCNVSLGFTLKMEAVYHAL